MSGCIFCKIVSGQIPSKKIFEDDKVLAFYDIEPKAPIHFLVITKEHIKGVASICEENSSLIAHIYEVISKLTEDLKIESFRVVTNNGTEAGQSVFHLHFHVLAGGVLGGMA